MANSRHINYRQAATLALTTEMSKKQIVDLAGGDSSNASRFFSSKLFLTAYEEVKAEYAVAACIDRNSILKSLEDLKEDLHKNIKDSFATNNERAKLSEAFIKVCQEESKIVGAYTPTKHLRVDTDADGVRKLNDPVGDAIKQANRTIDTEATIIDE